MGQMYEMMDDCDNIMDHYRMSHCQSCHVMDGHWLMYEQPHYKAGCRTSGLESIGASAIWVA